MFVLTLGAVGCRLAKGRNFWMERFCDDGLHCLRHRTFYPLSSVAWLGDLRVQ